MTAVERVATTIGTAPACQRRWVCPADPCTGDDAPRRRRVHGRRRPRALDRVERQEVLDLLHTRFVDQAPAQVHATLLDEGTYLCSPRTMYRLLGAADEVKERRDQVRRPALRSARAVSHAAQRSLELGHHQAPRAGQVDLLLSLCDPRHLQSLRRRLDGRAARERGAGGAPDRRDLREARHSAQGNSRSTRIAAASMRSKPVALLLADLGVTKTHSRPHVSNDNPFSEAQFKTLKYCPAVSRAVRLDRGWPRVLPDRSFAGTTTTIITAGSAS